MTPCDELAVLLAAHASGEVDAAERARVEAHLETCAACRAEREALVEALSLAALPEPSELELRALSVMPVQVRAAFEAQERTRSRFALWVAGAAAAAALVTFGVGRLPGRAHAPVRAAPAAAPAEVARAAEPAAADPSVDVDALADGPLELADEGTDPYANDPELAVDDLSLEGDL